MPQIQLLKAKLHRIRVTETELEYEGSITLDPVLMEKAGILHFEKVLVANLRNGERFETYVVRGERGSGTVCINGAVGSFFPSPRYAMCSSAPPFLSWQWREYWNGMT